MKVIRRSAVFSAAGQSPNKVAKLSRMWSVVVVAVAIVYGGHFPFLFGASGFPP